MEVGSPNLLHFCFSVLDEFEHTFLIEQMVMLITEKWRWNWSNNKQRMIMRESFKYKLSDLFLYIYASMYIFI